MRKTLPRLVRIKYWSSPLTYASNEYSLIITNLPGTTQKRESLKKKAEAISQLNHEVKATMDSIMLFTKPTKAQPVDGAEMDKTVNNLVKDMGKVNSIFSS